MCVCFFIFICFAGSFSVVVNSWGLFSLRGHLSYTFGSFWYTVQSPAHISSPGRVLDICGDCGPFDLRVQEWGSINWELAKIRDRAIMDSQVVGFPSTKDPKKVPRISENGSCISPGIQRAARSALRDSFAEQLPGSCAAELRVPWPWACRA